MDAGNGSIPGFPFSAYYILHREPGLLSRYSNGLWAGKPGFNSQLHSIQTGSVGPQTSYTMDTLAIVPGGKAVGA
jgi:hypothetical protein